MQETTVVPENDEDREIEAGITKMIPSGQIGFYIAGAALTIIVMALAVAGYL